MAISRSLMERQLRAGGGLMTLEEPRQGYFLGKIVKKAKRFVKKIVKSPVGKLAILGGLGAYAGGLGPDNLEEELKRIEEVAGDRTIWIDMETKVRSDGDRIFESDLRARPLDRAYFWYGFPNCPGFHSLHFCNGGTRCQSPCCINLCNGRVTIVFCTRSTVGMVIQ